MDKENKKFYLVVEYFDGDVAPLNVVEVFTTMADAEKYIAESSVNYIRSGKRFAILEEETPVKEIFGY